jgi:hypothetical protein
VGQPVKKKNRAVAYLPFITFPQQINSWASPQPQDSLTVTTRPQTRQVYRSPFWVFFAAFTVFFAAFAVFLTVFNGFFVAMAESPFPRGA